jgi:O-methyltransferase
MFNVHSHPLVSNQVSYYEVAIIIRELETVLQNGVVGDIVEFGCYTGTTSLFIARLLKIMSEQREFHVYDSFAGLPEKTPADNSAAGDQFKAGELKAPKAEFIKNFKQAGLALPIIHKGWFCNIPENGVPDKIAFAFLDGDFYESINDSLKLIEHKLSPGAVIVIDDYQSESLPGAQKAVNQWLKDKNYKIHHEKSLAIVRC